MNDARAQTPASTVKRKAPAKASALADSGLWAGLSAEIDWDGFVASWLAIQCAQLVDCVRASAVVEFGDGIFVSHAWPAGQTAAELAAPIRQAMVEGRGVVAPGEEDGEIHAAYPVVVDAKPVGAVGIVLRDDDQDSVVAAMRLLQWGVSWLRERVVHELARLGEYDEGISAHVLDYMAVVLEQRRLVDAARALVTEIAEGFGCERASIGLMRGKSVRIFAISHTAHFEKQMNLVALLANAMNEAIDERHVVAFPPRKPSDFPALAHAELAKPHGTESILTAPLFLDDRPVGALTLERDRARPFTRVEAATLDILASAVAPVIEEKRLNERNLFRRLADDTGAVLSRFFLPDNAAYKLAAGAAIALFLLFFFWQGSYEIVADATIEGREQRFITAGFDGFLKSAPVRAGDVVAEGQVLATLDDRDLQLERSKWLAEQQQHKIEYEQALGQKDRTGLRVAESLVAQAKAQIELVDDQLARAKIVAPFDGVVVSGDLSQRIGDAVQKGETLFRLAPVNSHRIMLKIREEDAEQIAEGLQGRLVLAALPEKSFAIEIARVTPVFEVVDGRNANIVEALPVAESADFRPGLSGAARIEMGERRVIWIWTHAFFDWLRLAWWKLF